MLCAHTRQAWLPCAHSDCPQGSAEPVIERVVGRPGARRAVAFVATPMRAPNDRRGQSWVWVPMRTAFFIEAVLAGGRMPTPEEMLRAALGLG
jgi:hypothetical protein